MKLTLNFFCIHMSIQMIDLVAECPGQKTLALQFTFFHIFIQCPDNHVVRAGHLTSLSRKT